MILQPTIAASPALGVPGQVTLLFGVDFPPDARVGLTWNPGLLNFRLPVPVKADGTFAFPVMVLHRDSLGPRKIVASHVDGEQFGTVEGDFLVVPRTQFPPDFAGRG